MYPPQVILCNGAEPPQKSECGNAEPLHLEYRNLPNVVQNVNLRLPRFTNNIYHFPARVLDLIELAAYVFCGDRLVSRGPKDAVEYHRWSRSLHFVVRVRDYEFWKQPCVQNMLSEALCFMSGDRSYSFTFEQGEQQTQEHLFDQDGFNVRGREVTRVSLFSGGLDSLTGVLSMLHTTNDNICLVSHRSQTGTVRTQRALTTAIAEAYPGRIFPYTFHCTLSGEHAVEETQRTRAFLYGSIAYAISQALECNSFSVCENGITAMNLPRRQDMMNARASRTAHPKTLGLLSRLFTAVSGTAIALNNPMFWRTKAELFNELSLCGQLHLGQSSVSCSKTFQNLEQATHCGGCSQCIDRRFAAYAASAEESDHTGLYALDFIRDSIEDGEVRTGLVDYVRQARSFARSNIDHFYKERLSELADLVPYVGVQDVNEAVECIWNLCRRHGINIENALVRMRAVNDSPFSLVPENSFLQLMNDREYMKELVERLVQEIETRLRKFIPIAFQKNLPKNENDFNDKLSGLLLSWRVDFQREHPAVRFALANAVPDHSNTAETLYIEAKYLRGTTTPSKANEGIAADLIKYPANSHIMFVVYDPERAIQNDAVFSTDIERQRNCTVCIVR